MKALNFPGERTSHPFYLPPSRIFPCLLGMNYRKSVSVLYLHREMPSHASNAHTGRPRSSTNVVRSAWKNSNSWRHHQTSANSCGTMWNTPIGTGPLARTPIGGWLSCQAMCGERGMAYYWAYHTLNPFSH